MEHNNQTAEQIVASIVRDAEVGSTAHIDALTARLGGLRGRRGFVQDLVSKNPPLLGTGVAS